MKANPKLEIEKEDTLSLTPDDRLNVEEHSDLRALAYLTATSGTAYLFILCFTLLVFKWRPKGTEIDVAILGFFLFLMFPLAMMGFLHGRRIFWYDKHTRKTLYWAERRMQRDLDGDGSIGVVLHDQSWFVKAVQHWYEGGSTTYEASSRDLGLSLAQWRAARKALIESGIGVGISRQGGTQGFKIKLKAWNDVLVRMPATPLVYDADDGRPAIAYAHDTPVSSLRR